LLEGQGGAAAVGGPLQLTSAAEDLGQAGVEAGDVGPKADRLVNEFGSLGEVTLLKSNQTEQVEGGRMVGGSGQGL
jgi:hypothetical protein